MNGNNRSPGACTQHPGACTPSAEPRKVATYIVFEDAFGGGGQDDDDEDEGDLEI